MGSRGWSAGNRLRKCFAACWRFCETRASPLFAVVDHSGEAAKAGIEMHETKLVIFGKPEAGTPVMIAAPDSALDLPLKILIAELADGGTQVSYNKSSYLQARFDLSANLVANIAVIEQIAAAISVHN